MVLVNIVFNFYFAFYDISEKVDKRKRNIELKYVGLKF